MSFINPDVRIKFIKDFTSPVFGNVWPTREVVCAKNVAQKMIDLGYAELVEKEAPAPKPAKTAKGKSKFDLDEEVI